MSRGVLADLLAAILLGGAGIDVCMMAGIGGLIVLQGGAAFAVVRQG